jgi:hypothetical protein
VSIRSRHSRRTVPTNRSAIAFRLRRPDRRTDHLHPLGRKHLVEGAAELGVPIVDDEAEAPRAIQGHREVARLLGRPGPARVRGHPAEVHASGLKLDEEHIEAPEPCGLDGEEVAGENTVSVRAQEGCPAHPGSSRCRIVWGA